jgi:hypothetical protein
VNGLCGTEEIGEPFWSEPMTCDEGQIVLRRLADAYSPCEGRLALDAVELELARLRAELEAEMADNHQRTGEVT